MIEAQITGYISLNFIEDRQKYYQLLYFILLCLSILDFILFFNGRHLIAIQASVIEDKHLLLPF